MKVYDKKKRAITVMTYILFVIMILVVLYFTYPKEENKDSESSSFFPHKLSGMTLEDEYSGERAKSEIKEMHLGDFDFISGHVGYYTDDFGRSARYWVSVFINEDEAKNITERMTSEISKGITPFSIPEDVDINNSKVENVYFVEGMGQDHYYWYKNDKVLWVALTNFDEKQGKILLNSSINALG
jgi:hypothetical protein